MANSNVNREFHSDHVLLSARLGDAWHDCRPLDLVVPRILSLPEVQRWRKNPEKKRRKTERGEEDGWFYGEAEYDSLTCTISYQLRSQSILVIQLIPLL